MNKSHLLNPDLGLQQLRPSSGRPFFESPIPDPALSFLFSYFFYSIMRKLQQTKDRACQVAGTQGTALGRGFTRAPRPLRSAREGKWSRSPLQRSPAPRSCWDGAGAADTDGPNSRQSHPFGAKLHCSQSVAKILKFYL